MHRKACFWMGGGQHLEGAGHGVPSLAPDALMRASHTGSWLPIGVLLSTWDTPGPLQRNFWE